MAKKILVIDDDEGIIEAFKVILESLGYDVTTSTDGDIVSTLTVKNFPHLILLDVLLSGADGRDICFALKNNKETQHIPIIMISAHPSAEDSVKEVGANDFLAKPFEISELTKKIEIHIS